MGGGGYGGVCTCGDGSTYHVGDNNDGCASLACAGGKAGKCERKVRVSARFLRGFCVFFVRFFEWLFVCDLCLGVFCVCVKGTLPTTYLAYLQPT